ncbi:hypothetical protein GE300_07855 [Rhodobacteraceae bacterium 2CG4]|uniref:Uncharacterized protein n=1 Tax=Halovulum marinum TaxID=2662447 RepID=A0A6L5YZ82_9RHOB|nr:hypothetical protein [Halovulum marinum]MSU89528.1 hypothetical protein [Halovulum marinum]
MSDPAEILVIFPEPDRSTIHRIGNFGEDVWTTHRENRRADVYLGEVDTATDRIRLEVRRGEVTRERKHLAKIIERHLRTGECLVSDREARGLHRCD